MIRLFLNVCKTFQQIKHKKYNDYSLYCHLISLNEEFSCPSCKAPREMFSKNGHYSRHFVCMDDTGVQEHLIEVSDVKCLSCGKTHALLYSLIIPHCPYSISFLVSLIYYRLTRRFQTIAKLSEFFGISERTFYRIWNRILMDSHAMNAILHTYSDLMEAFTELFAAESDFLHNFLKDFFQSCGYSFLQPCITFRRKIKLSSLPPDNVR